MYSSLDFGFLLALPRRLVAIPQRRSRMLRMLFRLSIDIPRFSSGPGDTRTELAYQQSQTRTESCEQLNIVESMFSNVASRFRIVSRISTAYWSMSPLLVSEKGSGQGGEAETGRQAGTPCRGSKRNAAWQSVVGTGRANERTSTRARV